jgi:hypothetical protein
VLHPDRVQELDDEIRTVSWSAAVLQVPDGHNGQCPVGEAAAFRKSASVKP